MSSSLIPFSRYLDGRGCRGEGEDTPASSLPDLMIELGNPERAVSPFGGQPVSQRREIKTTEICSIIPRIVSFCPGIIWLQKARTACLAICEMREPRRIGAAYVTERGATDAGNLVTAILEIDASIAGRTKVEFDAPVHAIMILFPIKHPLRLRAARCVIVPGGLTTPTGFTDPRRTVWALAPLVLLILSKGGALAQVGIAVVAVDQVWAINPLFR